MDPVLWPVIPSPPEPRPRVEVNFAQTWDAKISTRTLSPSDFSSPIDKRRLLQIRSRADAVLVGVRTAAADRMTLGLPDPDLRAQRLQRGQPELPLRILASNSGQIPEDLPVLKAPGAPLHVFSTNRMPGTIRTALHARAQLHLQDSSTLNLKQILEDLYKNHEVRHLVCEGGPTLLRSLLEADLVDVLNLTLCPRVFGGATAPSLTGTAGRFFPESRWWELERWEALEGECFLRYGRRGL